MQRPPAPQSPQIHTMQSTTLLALCAIGLCYAACAAQAATPVIDAAVQNRNVDRTVDLTAQNVKIAHKITLAHKTKQPITAYTFVLPLAQRKALAYISIRDAAKKELKYTETEIDGERVAYSIALPAPSTASGSTQVLYVETVFTQSVAAFPTEIAQNERQLVRYYGSAHFYSPYTTVAQKTTLLLSSKNVESYTPVKPSSLTEATLTYGPYENVPGE